MMGIGLWIVAGLGAFSLARLARAGRSRRWWGEAAMAVLFAAAAGLTATVLDFGGWREPDWRAGLFAFLVASGAIGLARVSRVIWSVRGRPR